MDTKARERAHVVFVGRVQGVGFRYTTVQVAASYAVTGTVQNLRDGSVELVAEGERAEVEAFLRAVTDRMGGYIQDAELTWGRATGEFEDFDVRSSWW